MTKARVFISFDHEHDEILNDFLVGQSKDSNVSFELTDWSLKEHVTEEWKKKMRERIKAVDVVAVICGEHTNTATSVNAEVAIAQEEKVPYILLQGYANKVCVKPKVAKDTDKFYTSLWPNLAALIGQNRDIHWN